MLFRSYTASDKIKTALFKSDAVTKWIKDNETILHGAITVT